jgi:tetratricopeptide (TPR) repeat protein
MQKLLKEISDRLRAFVDQRDDVGLVLVSPAAEAAPLLKILEGLEDASASDLYWSFTDNFTDAVAYANAIVNAFATKHEVVRLAMQKEKMTQWPPIPPQILSEQASPVQKLREVAAFSRELLPVPNGGNNVWIYFPLEIADQAAFSGLMAAVLRHEFPFPWCHHLRFIIRGDPAGEPPLLASSARVQRYQPDLSMDAITRSMEEELADESLPLQERMAPLPIMAGNDFAQARYPEAMEKYELLLRYHAPNNNFAMAAFALNGMGEVYEKQGDLERANESYEAALIPASHGENPAIPVLLNVVLNLGNLCVRQARWEDGEAYFDTAQQLATVARNAPAKIGSLEKRGVCQQQQGKNEEAAKSWHDGAVIAALVEDVDSCRTLLARLEQYYSAAGQTAKAHELQEQVAALCAA